MTRITFPQPDQLLNLNDRLHWAKKAGIVKTWRYAVALHARAQAPGPKPPAVVRVTLPCRLNRKRDAHNWVATVKPCIDGLVDAGWWPDDDAAWVAVVDPTFATGTTVTIELEELVR